MGYCQALWTPLPQLMASWSPHPHQDHYGLLEEVPACWPVYCGQATARLIRLTSGIFGKRVPDVFIPWESGVPFEIGPFRITPLLTDHSAFDAYMMLIEVHGKRIFYSAISEPTD